MVTAASAVSVTSKGTLSPNSFAVSVNPPRRRPYIRAASAHYAYALLVTRPGEKRYTHVEACEELGLNQTTVRRWRRKLIESGREFFGDMFGESGPPYEFCARFAIAPEQTEQELRKLFGGN